MLVDQALHALPEILCGGAYPRHEHEGGVVSAFAMAILQELNGRNVPNPLSCLQTERRYWPKEQAATYSDRHLRADLCVSLDELRVGNVRIQTYGWRLLNWLEAKYFRGEVDRLDEQSKCGNTTTHSADLLVELIRLAILVPEKPPVRPVPWLTRNGRYLLHVYDAEPVRYVALRKYKTQTSPKSFKRLWLEKLFTPGVQVVEIKDLGDEGDTFREAIGDVTGLEMVLTVTNRLVEPMKSASGVSGRIFWCHLTRIDRVEVRLAGAAFTISEDRSIAETQAGDFERIRQSIAASIEITKEETEPEAAAADEDVTAVRLADVQAADEVEMPDSVVVEKIEPEPDAR